MNRYRNSGGDSGVSGYEIGIDYIQIRFSTGKIYSYSYRRAGKRHVDQMKILAEKGKGLNTYLNKYVKDLCD